MSDDNDKPGLWPAVRANWPQITGGCAVLLMLHLFVMSVMVNSAVAERLGGQDLDTDLRKTEKIINMDTSIAYNARTGEENAEDIDINRRNGEAAFRRLLGLPPAELTP